MDTLRVYESPYPKKRIGRDRDGGYIISELPGAYDCFISGGISNDISFEQAFLNVHPGLPCYAYDGTISGLPVADPRITFIKKNLGATESDTLTNLHGRMEPFTNIFMKLDIEGHEFRLLPTLLDGHMQRVKQLVIEIHSPGDIQLHPTYFKGLSDITHPVMFALLRRLNETHTLVHLHPNNGCATHYVDDILVPNVFECTYVRNDMVAERRLNKETLPTSLDRRNLPQKPEIVLQGFPWSA
jgi:hypothetical protein